MLCGACLKPRFRFLQSHRREPNKLTGARCCQFGRAFAPRCPQRSHRSLATKELAIQSPCIQWHFQLPNYAIRRRSNGKDTAADKSRCGPRIGALATCPKAANLGQTHLADIVELPLSLNFAPLARILPGVIGAEIMA